MGTNKDTAYGFRCFYLGNGCWRLHWAVDYYYPDSHLRFPRGFNRITDEAGMVKFCKKHLLVAAIKVKPYSPKDNHE